MNVPNAVRRARQRRLPGQPHPTMGPGMRPRQFQRDARSRPSPATAGQARAHPPGASRRSSSATAAAKVTSSGARSFGSEA